MLVRVECLPQRSLTTHFIRRPNSCIISITELWGKKGMTGAEFSNLVTKFEETGPYSIVNYP